MSADQLHLDYETASDADLLTVGLDVYTSPQSNPRVLMAAYRINDQRLQHWQPHLRAKPPAELVEALKDPWVQKRGFGAQFERVVTNRVLGIPSPVRNWRCSMVLAYMQSFTGGLADVARQIGLPEDKQKMKDSKRLIRMFTMPQRITTNQPYLWRNWITDPELWEEFVEYNKQDVVAEEAIEKRLSPFPVPEVEWDFYELDQIINDRGLPIDVDFVQNVIWMSRRRKEELLREMRRITGIGNPNSVGLLHEWLRAQGYPWGDLRKETVEKEIRIIEGETSNPDYHMLTDDGLTVLKMRVWASKTSVNKAVTALRCLGADDRCRYLYQFAGAQRTNRFAGRLVQPQNLTRTPKVFDPEDGDEKLNYVTNLIRVGDYTGFDLFVDEPMMALSGCMRGMFRAPDGEEMLTMDLSSVESAGLAWVSNCERLLNVFAKKLDPYKDFGTMFYQKAYDQIDRAERQICKPPTLGCGYRLGPGVIKEGVKTGLLKYAEDMGVQMTQDQAKRAVKVFRTGYPEVPQYWYGCETAVKQVFDRKKPVEFGRVTFEWQKPYLTIKLPSGRRIYYYKPILQNRTVVTGKMIQRRSRGEIDGAPKGELIDIPETYQKLTLTYMGRDKKNQWRRLDAHGGVTTENIVQALTRDILRVCLMRMHEAGFNLVGHSHDEGVALQRIGDNYCTMEKLRNIFTTPIAWAPDFPLGAKGWAGAYYRK